MARPIDTSPAAWEAQLAAIRRLTPARRVALAAEMSDEIRAIAAAGIRSRHPNLTPDEVDDALAELLLGSELAEKRRGRTAARR